LIFLILRHKYKHHFDEFMTKNLPLRKKNMEDLTLEVVALEQHQNFIRKIVASGIVWGLESDEGWATAMSNHFDETVVVPFWSDSDLAAAAAQEDWEGYEPTMVDMSEFLEAWLMGMHNDEHLIGTNWTSELMGLEKEPIDAALEVIALLMEQGKRLKLEVHKDLEHFQSELRRIKLEEM
jgi:hypothetical protein